MFCHIGTGTTASFWYDNWTGLGSLVLLVGTRGISLSGIPISSTVDDAIHQGHWRLSQRSRNPILSFLRDVLPDPATILHPSTPDSFSWTAGIPSYDPSSRPVSFRAATTFQALSPNPPEVPWYKRVWFSGHIPKHAFHAWIIARDRLPTRDKLRRYNPSVPPNCLLCSSGTETRDHIFFHCPYSHSLLASVLHMTPPHLTFDSILQWIPSSSTCRHLRYIGHLLVQASAYIIWRERNNRLHNSTFRPHHLLLRDINMTVKAKLASLSKPASTISTQASIMQVWFGLQEGVPCHSFQL